MTRFASRAVAFAVGVTLGGVPVITAACAALCAPTLHQATRVVAAESASGRHEDHGHGSPPAPRADDTAHADAGGSHHHGAAVTDSPGPPPAPRLPGFERSPDQAVDAGTTCCADTEMPVRTVRALTQGRERAGAVIAGLLMPEARTAGAAGLSHASLDVPLRAPVPIRPVSTSVLRI